MFKPLLRTLPSLSGNVKLECWLNEINRIDNNNSEAYVRDAHLYPISSNIFQKDYKVSLLNSKYEFDLSGFYRAYNNYFYTSSFIFNTSDNEMLNKSIVQKSRDTDFELGCKRISYIKNGKEYSFFAPFYIDDVKDIPDYFIIKINLSNNIYSTTKYLKIHINTDSTHNYLGLYLKRYCSKIDNKVVFCRTDINQAIYYGINVNVGGFVKSSDSMFSSLFKNHNSINNVDAILCNGFKRLNLVMKQIIPLSFTFSVNDVLSDIEKDRYKNAKVDIMGYYVTNGEANSFYDFSIDYHEYYEDYLTFKDNAMKWVKGNNIMNMPYPSLREAEYIKYIYKNNISPWYSRWKMILSSDEHPYIINMSNAFSVNQNSSYRYGQFPIKFNALQGIAKQNKNGGIYDIVFPSSDPELYRNTLLSNTIINKYDKIFKTYGLNWFNTLDEYANINKWADVVENKTYFNGILYDLSIIYKKYTNDNGETIVPKIDKFAVFINPNFNVYKVSDIHTKIIFSDYVIHTQAGKYINGLSPNCDINDSFLQGNGQEKLAYLYIYPDCETTEEAINKAHAAAYRSPYILTGSTKDNISCNSLFTYEGVNGNFINPLDYGLDIYESNKYYNISDIMDTAAYITSYYSNDNIKNSLYAAIHYSDTVKGKEIIPIYNLGSITSYHTCMQLNREWNKDANQYTYTHTYYSHNYNLFDEFDEDCSYLNLSYNSLRKNLYVINNCYEDTLCNINNWNTYSPHCPEGLSQFDLYRPSIYNNYDATAISSNSLFENFTMVLAQTGNYCSYSELMWNIGKEYEKLHNTLEDTELKVFRNIISYMTYNLDKCQYQYCPIVNNGSQIYANNIFVKTDINAGNNYNIVIPDDKFDFDNDVLYIDPYNLKNMLGNKADSVFKKLSFKNLYAKLLNKTNIKYYFTKLYTYDYYEDGEIKTWPSKDIEYINRKIKALDNIYIRNRYIDYNGRVIVDDVYSERLLPYVFNDWDEVKYGDGHNLNYINKIFIELYRLLQYDTDKELFYIKGKDRYFELVINKQYAKINKDIWDLININIDDTTVNNIYKDIYIYRLEKDHEYTSNINININKPSREDIGKLLDYKTASLRKTLTPLFDNIFEQEKEETVLYTEFCLANIYPAHNISKTKYVYKYNINTVNYMWEISDGTTEINGIPLYSTYNKISSDKTTLSSTYNSSYDNLSISTITTYSYELINITEAKGLDKYNGSYYLNTYNTSYIEGDKLYKTVYDINNGSYMSYIYKVIPTELTCAYYMINVNIDNTLNTVNIIDENQNTVKYFKSVNGKNLVNDPSEITTVLKLLLPFVKTNIFTVFNDINTVVYPKLYNIESMYVPNRISNSYDKETDTYSTDIKQSNDVKSRLSFLRYFDSITPYIKEVSCIENNYHLKYKTTQIRVLNDEQYPNQGNVSIYRRNDIIDKYQGLWIFNTISSTNVGAGVYIPTEYKYFCDNHYINLEPYFTVEHKGRLLYDELHELENTENVIKVFTEHINTHSLNNYDSNNILFLFNKYEVQYDTIPVGLNLTLTEKTYKLIYKFILK